jgi:uncharacterized small protein (DUF1192 family)
MPRSTALLSGPIDSKQPQNHPARVDDDDLPRPRGDAASQLAREPLDTYSQDELMERVALLEAEIARVRAHHEAVAEKRKLADQLFKPREPS